MQWASRANQNRRRVFRSDAALIKHFSQRYLGIAFFFSLEFELAKLVNLSAKQPPGSRGGGISIEEEKRSVMQEEV